MTHAVAITAATRTASGDFVGALCGYAPCELRALVAAEAIRPWQGTALLIKCP